VPAAIWRQCEGQAVHADRLARRLGNYSKADAELYNNQSEVFCPRGAAGHAKHWERLMRAISVQATLANQLWFDLITRGFRSADLLAIKHGSERSALSSLVDQIFGISSHQDIRNEDKERRQKNIDKTTNRLAEVSQQAHKEQKKYANPHLAAELNKLFDQLLLETWKTGNWIMLMGDGEFYGMKGRKTAPKRKLLTYFQQISLGVVLVNECYTSKLSCCCHAANIFPYRDKIKYNKETKQHENIGPKKEWGTVHCCECKRTWQRDNNSAYNIAWKAIDYHNRDYEACSDEFRRLPKALWNRKWGAKLKECGEKRRTKRGKRKSGSRKERDKPPWKEKRQKQNLQQKLKRQQRNAAHAPVILDALRHKIRQRSQRQQQRLEKRKTAEHKNTDARKRQVERRKCASEIRKPKRKAKPGREAKELPTAAASSHALSPHTNRSLALEYTAKPSWQSVCEPASSLRM
jgi:hypothetical protein